SGKVLCSQEAQCFESGDPFPGHTDSHRLLMQIEPTDEGAWNNKGLCLLKNDELSEALNCINNAIEIDSEFADALINKALILERQNKISGAVRIMNKLVSMRPEKAEFHYIRAAYLEAMGDYREALKSAVKSSKLNPDDLKILGLKKRLEDRVKGMEDDRESPRLAEDRKKGKGMSTGEDIRGKRKTLEKKISRGDLVVKKRDMIKSDLETKRTELQELIDVKEGLVDSSEEKEEVEKYIEEKRKEIEELNLRKEELSEDIQEFVEDLKELKEQKGSLEEEIMELEKELSSRDLENAPDEKALRNKEGEIEKLKKKQRYLVEELACYRKKEYEYLKEARRKMKIADKDTKLLRKAHLLYSMGGYQRALDLVEDAGEDEVLNLKGCCYYNLRMEKEAEDTFKKGGDLIEVKYNLEKMFFEQGRYREVRDISDDIMQDMAESHMFWEKRGEVMRRLGKHEDAILSYTKAIETSDIILFDVVKVEAICRVEIDGVKETVRELKARKYSTPEMKNLLATYMYIARQYDKSLDLFEDAVKYPKALYYNNQGCAAYQNERFGEALSAFEKAVELGEEAIYLNNLGFCQLQRDLIEAAEDTFERALKLSPNDPSSWYHLGIAMKRLEKEGWREKVKKAVALRGDFEAAKRLLKT
ncbi:MAG: tetratricopeptide repeat protein, partial [Thermoplasmata archaeon]